MLTTGRLMAQYQSGTQTRRVPARHQSPDPHVQLHPDLARKLGIAASDMVELRTRRGAAVFRAQITDAIRPDSVFVPFHWGGASNANALTNPALDPYSKMPAFKVCAVACPTGRRPRRRPPARAVPVNPTSCRPRPRLAHPDPAADNPPHHEPHADREGHSACITKNRFLQGIYPASTGAGLDKPAPINAELTTSCPTA